MDAHNRTMIISAHLRVVQSAFIVLLHIDMANILAFLYLVLVDRLFCKSEGLRCIAAFHSSGSALSANI